MRKIICTLSICLLVLGMPVTASESDAGKQSTDMAATDAAGD